MPINHLKQGEKHKTAQFYTEQKLICKVHSLDIAAFSLKNSQSQLMAPMGLILPKGPALQLSAPWAWWVFWD